MKNLSFRYRQPDLGGMGFSASSTRLVLDITRELYIETGDVPTKHDVARKALELERRLANGRAVAANDVYPIVFGGVLNTHTQLVTIVPEPLRNAEEWLGQHLSIAFNPNGKRHCAPGLLEKLFQDQDTGQDYVRMISYFAEIAGAAIRARDVNNLARAITRYRWAFDAWTQGAYISRTKKMARKLKKALSREVLSWKPPGAGACESLIILSPNQDARNAVIQFLRSQSWYATAVAVTTGMSVENLPGDKLRISAGYRLDLVGAADLGQDASIQQKGCCCSCAIGPRAEILMSRN
jgi:galactokinase/mevalonate kinase-like predicted kinase